MQFGFRKGRGTTDAIYTMNYIVNKELSRKGGKIFAFFADLRAVFDNVDRRQLSEMKKIKTKNNLRQRIIEIYKETRNIIKIGDKKIEEFWKSEGSQTRMSSEPNVF